MHLSAAAVMDLALLTDALHDPATSLAPDIMDTIVALVAGARTAVPSLLGLTVTITTAEPGQEPADRVLLRCTLLDQHTDRHHIKASLRLPHDSDGGSPGRASSTVALYAATPGAFVDLAADLSFLTGDELAAGELDQQVGVALKPDITGVLQAERTIGEALGVLLARGRTRAQASAERDTLAGAAHTDRHTAAADILTALTR